VSRRANISLRFGFGGRTWAVAQVSRQWLIVAAVLSVGVWQATEYFVRAAPHPHQVALVAAAHAALSAQREIARTKEEMGLLQSLATDPNQTGLIGPEWSEITTTIGDLPAKRTVANPDLAAMLARILLSFDPTPGAAVGLVLSGSFVGANLAAITAVEALGLRPVIVSSLGASMYGANDPTLTWLDMEALVRRAGIWQARSVAVVLGGESGAGGGLNQAGRELLMAAARRNGYQPFETSDFGELKQRIHVAVSDAAPAGLIALVNSGGSVLGMGTCLDAYRLRSGVVRGQLSCQSGVPGLAHDFARRGVPVINILNVKRLALDWGLPFDPVPLPAVGKNVHIYGRFGYPLGTKFQG
jgi:poly-gamma-glutamate system protein